MPRRFCCTVYDRLVELLLFFLLGFNEDSGEALCWNNNIISSNNTYDHIIKYIKEATCSVPVQILKHCIYRYIRGLPPT
jgi:hypothetical protein